MPDEDRPEFDLNGLLQGLVKMATGAKGVGDNARKTVTGFVETVTAMNRAANSIEQLATRMTKMVDDIEAPLRALTPEFEKATVRMQRLADVLDGPIDRIIPNLEAAIGTFDRLAVSQLPDSLEAVRSQLNSVMEAFTELPRRFAPMGEMLGLDRLLSAFGGMARPPSRPPTGPIPADARDATPAPSEPMSVPAPTAAPGATYPAPPARKASAVRKARAARKAPAARSAPVAKKARAARKAPVARNPPVAKKAPAARKSPVAKKAGPVKRAGPETTSAPPPAPARNARARKATGGT